jgi:hypothetical protein
MSARGKVADLADFQPAVLIDLPDDNGSGARDNGVTVTVLGPNASGGLDAEIVVDTPFVSGRLDWRLTAWELGDWAKALDRLDAGEDITVHTKLLDFGIRLNGDHDCPEAVIHEAQGSMVAVTVPFVPRDGWIADRRRRLTELMERWPPKD